MKKLFIAILIFAGILVFSQNVSDLKFVTNPVEAENSYVVLPKKETDTKYSFGFVYFDESAGYTYRDLGSLEIQDGHLKISQDDFYKQASMISRIGNFNLKLAKLDGKILQKLNLESPPEWLKIYKITKDENARDLRKASVLNGMNQCILALPILNNLYAKNYKTTGLYFEKAFAHNAVRQLAEGEKIALEAIANGKTDDLIYKEYVYSLVNQNKLSEADKFLTENFLKFKNDQNKNEAVINMVASSLHYDNLVFAEKWLQKLKDIPNSSRYQKNIDQLENILKKKKSKIL